jgi:2-aminoethylphosphonate-pyruvate transaminase
LKTCAHNSSSLSLDLFDQWRGFEANGQWRFTPPVQVVAALGAALDQLQAEGGIAARHARYRRNRDVLVQGMGAFGFSTYIDSELQAPVIVTFRIPAGTWFQFQGFYDFLHARGIVIYPGKLTHEPSFRIGCIGAIESGDMMRALAEIEVFVAAHQTSQSAA